LLLAGFRELGLGLLEQQLPASITIEERPARARVLAGQLLVKAGAWKEAESLHTEALRAIDPAQLAPEKLAATLAILRTESDLLSHELSLALSHGSLATPPAQAAEGDDHWKSLSRSQLGQDLWVLEQLGWKRNGFLLSLARPTGCC